MDRQASGRRKERFPTAPLNSVYLLLGACDWLPVTHSPPKPDHSFLERSREFCRKFRVFRSAVGFGFEVGRFVPGSVHVRECWMWGRNRMCGYEDPCLPPPYGLTDNRWSHLHQSWNIIRYMVSYQKHVPTLGWGERVTKTFSIFSSLTCQNMLDKNIARPFCTPEDAIRMHWN